MKTTLSLRAFHLGSTLRSTARRSLSVIGAPMALMLTASQLHAVTSYQGATDSWTTVGNWSGGVVPAGAFNQRININSTRTVTFSAAQGTVDIGGLVAEARALVLAPAAGTATLNITGGILRANASSGPTATSLVSVNVNGSIGILNISGGLLDLTTTDTASGRILSIGFNQGGTQVTSGTVTLSGTGTLKVSDLRFNSDNTAPTGGGSITGILNLNSGGTLETGSIGEGPSGVAQATTFSTVNLNGGLLKLTAATGISASLDTVNVLSGGANIEVAPSITATSGKNLLDGTGGGGLTKTGTGTLTLTSASTYTGATVISAGTLNAAKIVVSSSNSSLGNATSAVTLGSAGSQGTLSYTGSTAAYTRGFTIGGTGGGRLDVTTSGQTLTVQTGDITGSGPFTVGGAGSTSITSNITHTGGLTKADAGTLAVSGSNTYSGATAVNGGVLAVNGTLANTTTTVGNTGTLQGGGSIAGSVTVQSGGKLAPGNSIQSLGTGALSFENGSTYAYELQTNLYGTTPGEAGDLTFSSGTLDIQAGSILTLTDLAASTVLAVGSKLTLISYISGWTGVELFSYDAGSGLTTLADDSTFTLGANQWRFDYNDTSGGVNYTADQTGASAYVTMSVVPEPSAALLGALGLLALLRRRRS